MADKQPKRTHSLEDIGATGEDLDQLLSQIDDFCKPEGSEDIASSSKPSQVVSLAPISPEITTRQEVKKVYDQVLEDNLDHLEICRPEDINPSKQGWEIIINFGKRNPKVSPQLIKQIKTLEARQMFFFFQCQYDKRRNCVVLLPLQDNDAFDCFDQEIIQIMNQYQTIAKASRNALKSPYRVASPRPPSWQEEAKTKVDQKNVPRKVLPKPVPQNGQTRVQKTVKATKTEKPSKPQSSHTDSSKKEIQAAENFFKRNNRSTTAIPINDGEGEFDELIFDLED